MNISNTLTKRVMLSVMLCGLLLGGMIAGMVNLSAGIANAAPPLGEQAAPMGDGDEGGDEDGDDEGGNEGNEGGNEGNEGNEGGNDGNEGNQGSDAPSGNNQSQHKDGVAPPLTAGATCELYTEAAVSGGFSVCDDDNAQFRTTFERYGLQNVGYPISTRFIRDGFIVQAFQKAVFQWRADTNEVAFVNVFDELHDRGFDEQLLKARQTPIEFPEGWDGDATSFEQVKNKRQALLNARPAIHDAYFGASNPLLFFGLPTSDIEDMGSHYAMRLQRAVLQEWKQAVPWAAAGEVTVANGGDIAKELGHFPQVFLIPEEAPESGEQGSEGEEGEAGHGEGSESGEHGEGREGGEGEGEGEGGEGEESAQTYAKDETYDQVRNGARLVIAYDAASNAFNGTVQNTTNQPLCQVRVEVHLVGGSELGPTTPTDLAPGQTMNVQLSAAGETVDRWSAHPEISACSGSEGSSESSGEHSAGSEGSGEGSGGSEGGEGSHGEGSD